MIELRARGGGERCPFCFDDLGTVEISRCNSCGVGIHAECARESPVCPTAGCARRWPRALAPAPAPARADPRDLPSPSPLLLEAGGILQSPILRRGALALVSLLALAWGASAWPAPHESQRFGGWFTGHGDPLEEGHLVGATRGAGGRQFVLTKDRHQRAILWQGSWATFTHAPPATGRAWIYTVSNVGELAGVEVGREGWSSIRRRYTGVTETKVRSAAQAPYKALAVGYDPGGEPRVALALALESRVPERFETRLPVTQVALGDLEGQTFQPARIAGQLRHAEVCWYGQAWFLFQQHDLERLVVLALPGVALDLSVPGRSRGASDAPALDFVLARSRERLAIRRGGGLIEVYELQRKYLNEALTKVCELQSTPNEPVALDADGKTLAVGTRVYDLRQDPPQLIIDLGLRQVSAVELDDPGQQLLTCGPGETASLWNVWLGR